MHEALSDLMVLVWHGENEAAARAVRGRATSPGSSATSPSSMRACPMTAACGWRSAAPRSTPMRRRPTRLSLRGCSELIGQVLASAVEWPLARTRHRFAAAARLAAGEGDDARNTRSACSRQLLVASASCRGALPPSVQQAGHRRVCGSRTSMRRKLATLKRDARSTIVRAAGTLVRAAAGGRHDRLRARE